MEVCLCRVVVQSEMKIGAPVSRTFSPLNVAGRFVRSIPGIALIAGVGDDDKWEPDGVRETPASSVVRRGKRVCVCRICAGAHFACAPVASIRVVFKRRLRYQVHDRVAARINAALHRQLNGWQLLNPQSATVGGPYYAGSNNTVPIANATMRPIF